MLSHAIPPDMRRTWLLTPGLRTDRYVRALCCGADVTMVDIEDSVAVEQKSEAREFTRDFFKMSVDSSTVRGIRINGLTTIEGLLDLIDISRWNDKPQLILLPKAESPRDFDIVSAIIDTDRYTPELYALIETPTAVAQVADIAAHPRVAGLGFGAADYAITLGADGDWEPMSFARSAIVNAAHQHGKVAIDSPFFRLEDEDSLAAEANLARSWGFHGKGAIHPGQIEVIAAAFRSTEDELQFAREVIASADQSDGITTVRGHMIGAPFIAAARNIVNREEVG
jgi:(S)-citramalyl-CoA lyase